MKTEHIILSIETSCDETSLSLIRSTKISDTEVSIEKISHIVHSQAELHAEYGGVFPALAKREHASNLVPLMLELIKETEGKGESVFVNTGAKELNEKINLDIKNLLDREPELYDNIVRHLIGWQGNIDAIAITQGPGLEPALWVGINFARALGLLWGVKTVPINHMKGHMISALFSPEKSSLISPLFPILGLLISGGHTEIISMSDPDTFSLVGKTRDDAVGEAYDKVARLLDLPYPGGPEIARLALEARERNLVSEAELPRPMINTNDYDFSFSGLKTAVLYAVKDKELSSEEKMMLAGEFEEAIVDVLTHKLSKAYKEYMPSLCVVGGGVAANTYLRERLIQSLKEVQSDAEIYFPTQELATDNAFMIALALAFNISFGERSIEELAEDEIKATGNLHITS